MAGNRTIKMTLEESFLHLIENWKQQTPEYKEKYKSYKSKYLRSQTDSETESIGEGKMREMLLNAGYKENWSKI